MILYISHDSFVLYLYRGELSHDLSEFSQHNFILSKDPQQMVRKHTHTSEHKFKLKTLWNFKLTTFFCKSGNKDRKLCWFLGLNIQLNLLLRDKKMDVGQDSITHWHRQRAASAWVMSILRGALSHCITQHRVRLEEVRLAAQCTKL